MTAPTTTPAVVRTGAAPLPGTFVGAGSDSVAQRETASVLAAVRGEAAPPPTT